MNRKVHLIIRDLILLKPFVSHSWVLATPFFFIIITFLHDTQLPILSSIKPIKSAKKSLYREQNIIQISYVILRNHVYRMECYSSDFYRMSTHPNCKQITSRVIGLRVFILLFLLAAKSCIFLIDVFLVYELQNHKKKMDVLDITTSKFRIEIMKQIHVLLVNFFS